MNVQYYLDIQENLRKFIKKDQSLWYLNQDCSLPPTPSSKMQRFHSRLLQLRTRPQLLPQPQLPGGGLASLEENNSGIYHPAHRNLLLRLSTGGVWSRDGDSLLLLAPIHGIESHEIENIKKEIETIK